MFSDQDVKWMTLALELAEEAAECGEVPIGAVIVHGNKQIAAAKNRMEELRSATAHAEILAICEAGKALENWRLDGATLYVSLEPCQMCWGAIKNSRISRVVFAASDTRNSAAGTDAPHCTCEHGILEKNAAEILQKFFRSVRRQKGDSGAKDMANN